MSLYLTESVFNVKDKIMKPSQVATELRKIAAAIEASKTPDKTKVASAIKGLVKKIANDEMTEEEKLLEKGITPGQRKKTEAPGHSTEELEEDGVFDDEF